MNRTLVLLAFVTLSGCAIKQRAYTPPTSGDVAHIKAIRTSMQPSLSAPITIAIFKHPETCRERYWLQGSVPFTDMETSFARVPVGAPMSVAIHVPLGGNLSALKYCVPVLMFTPEVGKYYRASVAAVERGCQVVLESSNSSSMTSARRVPFKQMTFSVGFDENSSFCSPG